MCSQSEMIESTLSTKFSNPKTVTNFHRKLVAYAGNDTHRLYESLGLVMSTTTKEERALLFKMMKCGVDIWGLYPQSTIPVQKEEIIDNEVYHCKNRVCRSKKTYATFVQKRSADEGMSCFIVCSECTNTYQVS